MQNINYKYWKANISNDANFSELIWYYGIWYSGCWLDGAWIGGIFMSGTWYDGEWRARPIVGEKTNIFGDGVWTNGNWIKGEVWHRTKLYDTDFNHIISKISPKSCDKPKSTLSLNYAKYL